MEARRRQHERCDIRVAVRGNPASYTIGEYSSSFIGALALFLVMHPCEIRAPTNRQRTGPHISACGAPVPFQDQHGGLGRRGSSDA